MLLAFLARHGYLEAGTAGSTPTGAGHVTRLADTAWPEARPPGRPTVPSWWSRSGRPSSTGPTCRSPPTPTSPWPWSRRPRRRTPSWWSPRSVAYGSSGEHDGFAGTLSIGRGGHRGAAGRARPVGGAATSPTWCWPAPTAATPRPWPERSARLAAEGHPVTGWWPRWCGRPPRRADRDLADAGHRPRPGPDSSGPSRATAGPPTCCSPCSRRAGSGRSAPTGCWATPPGPAPPRGSD